MMNRTWNVRIVFLEVPFVLSLLTNLLGQFVGCGSHHPDLCPHAILNCVPLVVSPSLAYNLLS